MGAITLHEKDHSEINDQLSACISTPVYSEQTANSHSKLYN